MRRLPIQSFIVAFVVLVSVLVSKATLNSIENTEEHFLANTISASVGPNTITEREFDAPFIEPAPNVSSGDSEADELPLADETPSLEPPLPKLTAVAALGGRIDDEQIFYKINAYQRWPAASLTKLMTALVVREKLDPETIVTFTPAEVLKEGEAGNFLAGESYTVHDLLQAMLAVSSNDAAAALSAAYGDAGMIEAMNRRAHDIGMSDTVFEDPTGLSYLNQTTAWDLMKLARFLSETHPEIFAMTRVRSAAITERTSGKKRIIVNINQFAGQQGFYGGKTGYTDEARQNLLSLFKQNGATQAIIVLGSESRFEETEKILEWLAATAAASRGNSL